MEEESFIETCVLSFIEGLAPESLFTCVCPPLLRREANFHLLFPPMIWGVRGVVQDLSSRYCKVTGEVWFFLKLLLVLLNLREH